MYRSIEVFFAAEENAFDVKHIPDHTELIELGAKKTRPKPPEWSAPVSLKSTRTVAA
ncbi:MAG: hypothetical protein WBW13_19040 [Pseudolabrys sp.]